MSLRDVCPNRTDLPRFLRRYCKLSSRICSHQNSAGPHCVALGWRKYSTNGSKLRVASACMTASTHSLSIGLTSAVRVLFPANAAVAYRRRPFVPRDTLDLERPCLKRGFASLLN